MDLSYLRGIVFDLDGTLADSRLDFTAMRRETGCPQGGGLLEFIDQLPGPQEQQRALAVIHHYEMLGAQAATWITGAEPVLGQLRERAVPIGIFTRNSREAASLMIEALSIPCDHLVAREDAPAKPDPAGLHQIAQGWQLAPSQLLCVGDFLYDLQAAANAGMASGLYDPAGTVPIATTPIFHSSTSTSWQRYYLKSSIMTKPADFPTEPAALWEHFYQITQIPRPSAEEGAVRDYVTGLAEQAGHTWRSDARGNVVLYVAGSPARESQAPLIIQNHLDMVTVKTDDKVHNFSSDPLSLQVADGWLLADRTTLGADNGLGAAAALAVMTDTGVSHPPLELLFTVEEETGLYGASELDASLLSGNRMLNLDTEDWGELFVGCAGGRGWILRRGLQRRAAGPGFEGWCLNLRGLAGGHSGIQIHQQLGNAVKLLGQWLLEARAIGIQLASFDAGIAHNVIPREGRIEFWAPPGAEAALHALNNKMLGRWGSYLPAADSALELQLVQAQPAEPLAADEQAQLQQMLAIFPHGAISYNAEQPADLVDLSINLALVRADADGFYLETTLRYFNDNEAQGLAQQVLALAEWWGCEVEPTVDYPGWQPAFDNPLLDLTSALYQELFAETPAIKAIHAGLECGILKSKKEGMDIVSFGPTIRGAHSPRERLEIATVKPFWTLLVTLLERL